MNEVTADLSAIKTRMLIIDNEQSLREACRLQTR